MKNFQQIEKTLASIIQQCPQYRQKVRELFQSYNNVVSQKHLQFNIITNPNRIQLPHSQTPIRQTDILPGTNVERQLKTEVLTFINNLLQAFPLNARAVYQESYLIIQNNRKINFVVYLIGQIKMAFDWYQKEDKKQLQRVFQSFLNISAKIFGHFSQICTLHSFELNEITRSLTDLYYEQIIDTRIVKYFYQLLQNGLRHRENSLSLGLIDNYKHNSIDIKLQKKLWPFPKGMTVFLWIKMLKQTDFVLLRLKTEQGHQLTVCVEDRKLKVICIQNANQINAKSSDVCVMSSDSEIIMIGIQLEEAGLFSSSYLLHLNLNGSLYQNVATTPNLQSSSLLTEFSLLNNLIGQFYSIIITSRQELDKFFQLKGRFPYGFCHEFQVQLLLQTNILNLQSIFCVFNPDRQFEGRLLNYADNINHAQFSGRIVSVKSQKYYQKQLEIYLPFVYLLSVIEQKDAEWKQLFDRVFMNILDLVDKYNYQTDNLLFLLYFLELNSYKITQKTADLLFQIVKKRQNFYMNLVVQYIDFSAISKSGLKYNTQLAILQNLSQKITLLYYLQTKWLHRWNQLQGFQQWWSPHFFYGQNDHPYDPNNFLYQSDRSVRYQWSVKNFVSKDYCKAILQPIFKLPKYGQINYYKDEYISKQYFRSEFGLNLLKQSKGQVIACKKVSNSRLDMLKSKLFGKRQAVDVVKKLQAVDIKQFSSNCLLIDTLSIIEGVVRITKQGYIIFASKHIDRAFDHMCIKGFSNQKFYYICIAFKDIRKIFLKRFNASNNAIYIKCKDGKQAMLHFYLKNASDFLNNLSDLIQIQKDSYDSYLQADQPFQWIDKYISNYEYLQWLNEIAGRNYNDVTQYPVIPWIYITDQDNPPIDDIKNYRDLTKNMGLQGDSDRIRYFLEKYSSNNSEELFSQYYFGTHYSSSAIVLNFMIRVRPYSIGAQALQSGKFDCADRIFHSYSGSWNNATTSPTDLRQLIPQIYTLPQMFINLNNYQYGLTQDKVNVDNVILPAWTYNNPYKFVSTLRRKLESRYVSQNVNSWIDLIYGYKQRGKDAIENVNIFYPLTYENCIDLDKVTELEERISFQTQIAHFGQNPAQIIGNNLHPSRRTIQAQWQDRLIADGAELIIQKCYLSKLSKQEKCVFKSVFQATNAILDVVYITNERFLIVRKHEYLVFRVLTKQKEFLLKQKQVNYELQSSRIGFNYKQLGLLVPRIILKEQVVLIGGFYNGYISIIFLREQKYNMNFKIGQRTVTALAYSDELERVLIGDDQGYLKVYKIVVQLKQINFQTIVVLKAHDFKINSISISQKASLACVCSQDQNLTLFNLYSMQIIRTIHHPKHLAISFAKITTNPLYSVVFYSLENSTIYVYSINGQFLDSICEKSGFIYNLHILRSTDFSECLVYLNAHRELFIWQLPFLRLKRKIKMKKEQCRVSCLSACPDGKMVVAGTQEGVLNMIANPASY